MLSVITGLLNKWRDKHVDNNKNTNTTYLSEEHRQNGRLESEGRGERGGKRTGWDVMVLLRSL